MFPEAFPPNPFGLSTGAVSSFGRPDHNKGQWEQVTLGILIGRWPNPTPPEMYICVLN